MNYLEAFRKYKKIYRKIQKDSLLYTNQKGGSLNTNQKKDLLNFIIKNEAFSFDFNKEVSLFDYLKENKFITNKSIMDSVYAEKVVLSLAFSQDMITDAIGKKQFIKFAIDYQMIDPDDKEEQLYDYLVSNEYASMTLKYMDVYTLLGIAIDEMDIKIALLLIEMESSLYVQTKSGHNVFTAAVSLCYENSKCDDDRLIMAFLEKDVNVYYHNLVYLYDNDVCHDVLNDTFTRVLALKYITWKADFTKHELLFIMTLKTGHHDKVMELLSISKENQNLFLTKLQELPSLDRFIEQYIYTKTPEDIDSMNVTNKLKNYFKAHQRCSFEHAYIISAHGKSIMRESTKYFICPENVCIKFTSKYGDTVTDLRVKDNIYFAMSNNKRVFGRKQMLIKARTYVTGMMVPKLEFDFNLTYPKTTFYSPAGVIDRSDVDKMESKEIGYDRYEDMFDFDTYGILAESGILSRNPIIHENKIQLTLEDILTKGADKYPGKKITYYVNSCRVSPDITLKRQKSLSLETLSEGRHLDLGIDSYISDQEEEINEPIRTIPTATPSWGDDMEDSDSDKD